MVWGPQSTDGWALIAVTAASHGWSTDAESGASWHCGMGRLCGKSRSNHKIYVKWMERFFTYLA